MKINTASNKKRFVIVSVAAIATLLLIAFILEKTRTTDFVKNPFYSEPLEGPTEEETREQAQTQAEQKADFLDKTSGEDTTQPAEVPTDTDTITLSFNQSSNLVVIHNELHGQGYSSGTCVLNIKNGDKTITQEAQIMYQPEYSMCAGFSVPIDPLGAGTWTVRLEVTPLNGQTLSKTVTTEVRL